MCRRHNILITPHKRDSAQCGEIRMHGVLCVQKARYYDQSRTSGTLCLRYRPNYPTQQAVRGY